MDSGIEIEVGDHWIKVLQKALLCFFFLLLPLRAVFAEHEPDHRYLISGYVRNEIGVPIPDASVLLEHKGGEKKNTTTNSDGYYETRFHLHNDNLGDEILVTVGGKSKAHKIQFDPEDGLSFRGGSVDFGAPGKEGAKIWIFLSVASLGVMVFLLYRNFFRKDQVQQKTETGKKGKRKKKKKK